MRSGIGKGRNVSEGLTYGELHAHSAFSFLDGASEPEELAAEAARLGLSSLALTDHDGLYGVVRFAQAAKQLGLATSFGAELHLPTAAGRLDEPTGVPDPAADHLVAVARGADGYRALSSAIARAHLDAGKKGLANYTLEGLGRAAAGTWLVLTGCRKGRVRRLVDAGDLDGAYDYASQLVEVFGKENVAVETTWGAHALDFERAEKLAQVARRAGLPLVATTNAHYANPRVTRLAQTLSSIRANRSLDSMEPWLEATSTRHLRSDEEMRYLHRAHPYAVDNAARLAAQTTFDFALVAPNLPPYPVPAGHTESTWLRELTYAGALERYGSREAERVAGAWDKIDHELRIIEDLGFPGYFLIVYDIVDFCRRSSILAQGRGSAANSAVCYALGITAVDAVHHGLLFERFLAPERDGPPDIDVDIESRRREEVIQYVYKRYDREHAAQVANVITYRNRSAVRDAAKALGFDTGQQDAWSKGIDRWGNLTDDRNSSSTPDPERAAGRPEVDDTARRDGFSPTGSELASFPQDGRGEIPEAVVALAEQLRRLPRHLGIHSGGMVLCDRPVTEVCPVEWARMEGRTVLQWDKEDCADAGLVKFDLLGLGMLTALRLAFEHVKETDGLELELHSLPADDPFVYELLQAADTVGVFQVESRAQIATLPRLKPKVFYDIVIEVALIRPGPIQGGSVHPYINRARKREKIVFAHPLLEKSLAKTLGVPLFQEQLMQMAIDTANFSPAEADQLRRAMGSKRSAERMEALHHRVLEGMSANGIPRATAEEIFDKLKAFADFGFPESHAFSFAYLVYASSWLKAHHPAAFYAGLLGAQPMGFYTPQSLMNDARRHGLTVLPPCVNTSRVHAHVEPLADAAPHGAVDTRPVPDREILNSTDTFVTKPGVPVELPTHNAIRIGLASLRNLKESDAARIVEAREAGPFTTLRDFQRRTALRTEQLEALAASGAFDSLGVSRREALWAAGVLTQEREDTLEGLSLGVEAPLLPDMTVTETAVADQWSSGINPQIYPTQLVRAELDAQGILSARQVNSWEGGRRITAAGVITHRQRPGTAAGVTFLSLEDETGIVNVVCSVGVWNKFRKGLRTAKAAIIRGRVEHADGATNLVAEHFTPLSLRVKTSSRDFQ
ncbi:error-prone DNA polymerase [Timonella senegalensis]|uniref:error-prone DNA polymerase n=1 Tax=Timonella senegalensis TaxID=1465825 RepID=UPI002FDDA586